MKERKRGCFFMKHHVGLYNKLVQNVGKLTVAIRTCDLILF